MNLYTLIFELLPCNRKDKKDSVGMVVRCCTNLNFLAPELFSLF